MPSNLEIKATKASFAIRALDIRMLLDAEGNSPPDFKCDYIVLVDTEERRKNLMDSALQFVAAREFKVEKSFDYFCVHGRRYVFALAVNEEFTLKERKEPMIFDLS
ncbi:MAG: hypothetical protein GY845_25880 [Planctomycetes bacterium]|nr:hypothetical protein [Planctomycetota bacterium]